MIKLVAVFGRSFNCFLVLAGVGSLLLHPLTAQAQVLEEIVVTAQKREQNIQDVSIAITAFSGEQLKELGLYNTRDLGLHVPGLLVADSSNPATTIFTLRGSNQTDFADHQEAPVAMYQDGVYNSIQAGIGFSFYDVERVEVLKGPQGTLFGRNATGGLIHIINAKPTETFEAYSQLTVAEYGESQIEGAVSGRLSDTVLGRFSFYTIENDGWIENQLVDGGDGAQAKNYNTRGQLLFRPNDDVELLINVRAGIDDGARTLGWHQQRAVIQGGVVERPTSAVQYSAFCASIRVPNPPNPGSQFGNCYWADTDGDPRTTSAGVENTQLDRAHYGFTSTLDWDLGTNKFTAIVDFQDFVRNMNNDGDGTPRRLFAFEQDTDVQQFSTEFRLAGELDKLTWVTGLYYLSIENENFTQSDFAVIPNPGLGTFNSWQQETTSYAAFAQGDYELSPNWTMTAGLRWTEDEKELNFDPRCFRGSNFTGEVSCSFLSPLVLQSGNFSGQTEKGDWSGKIGLDWQPNFDWLWYFGVTRGTKAGGMNSGSAGYYLRTDIKFQPEVLTNYEGGFKASIFDGRASLNASVYYYDYQNFQSFMRVGPSLTVFNVEARIQGAEIELVTNPVEGLEFLLGIALNDSEQTLAVFGKRPMQQQPDLTYNGLARYEWPALGGTLAIQGDLSYVGDRSLTATDTAAQHDESYLLTNARISYTNGDGTWQIVAFVRNLNDETYNLKDDSLAGFLGSSLVAVNPPRVIGASINYRWE